MELFLRAIITQAHKSRPIPSPFHSNGKSWGFYIIKGAGFVAGQGGTHGLRELAEQLLETAEMLLPAKLKTYLRRQLALLPHPPLSPPLALRSNPFKSIQNRVTSTQNQRTPAFTIQRLALPTKVCDHSNQCRSKEWQLMQASIQQFTYSNVNGRSWSVLFSVPSASTEGVFWEWSSSCDSTTDWNSWSIPNERTNYQRPHPCRHGQNHRPDSPHCGN